MADEVFKVTVEGPDTKLARNVSEQVALQIMALAVGSENQFTQAEPPASTQESPSVSDGAASAQDTKGKSPTSIGEFLADLNIDGNDDRIAAIALYLREEQDQQLVTKDELPEWFQKAGETAPGNVGRDLRKAIGNKLLAEGTGTSGSYYVTTTGEKKLRGSK